MEKKDTIKKFDFSSPLSILNLAASEISQCLGKKFRCAMKELYGILTVFSIQINKKLNPDCTPNIRILKIKDADSYYDRNANTIYFNKLELNISSGKEKKYRMKLVEFIKQAMREKTELSEEEISKLDISAINYYAHLDTYGY